MVNSLAGFIVFQASRELYQAAPELSKRLKDWLSISSRDWPSVTPTLIAIGTITFFSLLFLFVTIVIWRPEKFRGLKTRVIRVRESRAWYRWLIAVGTILPLAFLFVFTQLGFVLYGAYVRLLLLLIFGTIVAILTTVSENELVGRLNLAFGLLLVSSVFVCAAQLATVTDYPFSLYWSEGNRLYDYSIHFGSERYIYPGKLTASSGALGRRLLWGILFVIPNSPIWLHRLWNAVLSIIPYLVLGALLARWSKLGTLAKWTFAMWIFLFLIQGPIYTPLILSAILVVGLVRPDKLAISLVATAIAAFYANFSRWTWLLAPSAWAAFIWVNESDFNRFKVEKDHKYTGFHNSDFFRRLLPMVAVAIIGIIAGIIADPRLISIDKISKSTALSQPLLWYRLLPNATYPEGIIIGLVIATAPLLVLLIWSALSKRWILNWLQQLIYIGVSVVFLAMGLVASAKIGGGNNLHNLDMFLVTLALLCGLAFRQITSGGRTSLSFGTWPLGALVLLVLAVVIPAWNSMMISKPLQIPDQFETIKAQKIIRVQVTQAKENGEVLFIDQRQLLTFGTIQGVPLVAEYEKKYLMDQAMAGNAAYFENFYQDLKDHRFSLIISDPLFTQEKGESYTFGEENDAWVKWVAKPLLCYYKPLRTLSAFKVQLLIPQLNPINCP